MAILEVWKRVRTFRGCGLLQELAVPKKPEKPCPTCKGHKFWLRDKGWGKTEWVCERCHPCPYIENITWYEIEEGEGN